MMDVNLVANEIIIASQILHTNNINTIASELGYQPLVILNALYVADRDGKITWIKKKDIFKIHETVEIEALAVSEYMNETREQLELFLEAQNSIEKDITLEDVHAFLPQVPELHLKIAISRSTKLATYELSDPKDKESVYTFLTLAENLDKKWGTKQFDADNSRAKKHANRVAKK